MADVITTCPEHGIVAVEPTPSSITYVGKYIPGEKKFCPFCGKPTEITWPDEDQSLCWTYEGED